MSIASVQTRSNWMVFRPLSAALEQASARPPPITVTEARASAPIASAAAVIVARIDSFI